MTTSSSEKSIVNFLFSKCENQHHITKNTIFVTPLEVSCWSVLLECPDDDSFQYTRSVL